MYDPITGRVAFHGDPAIKQKYLDRVKAHAIADEIVQGIYWENGKGDVIGCIVETSDDPHKTMSKELGWPLWLVQLTDKLHEEQSNEDSKKWPVKIVEAVSTGFTENQFSIVEAKWFLWLLTDEDFGVQRHAKEELTIECIKDVAKLYQMVVDGKPVGREEWRTVQAAVNERAYAYYAYYATDAAKVEAVYHATHASSYSAANAASTGHAAANSIGHDALKKLLYHRQAEKLLQFLSESV